MSNSVIEPGLQDDAGHLLPLLYDSSKTHGWNAGMAAVMESLLVDLPLPDRPHILEIGCGSGAMLHLLSKLQPSAQVEAIDLNPVALSHAQRLLSAEQHLMQANLHRLPFREETFDLALALDTFDQNAVDLMAGLVEARRVLRRRGWLVLRVSAYPWLHGAHDVAFNTGRRYAREELIHVLSEAGFALQRITGANSLLSPAVIVMRLLQRRREIDPDANVYLSPSANLAIRWALQLESYWLRSANLPFGLSLIALAQKSD